MSFLLDLVAELPGNPAQLSIPSTLAPLRGQIRRFLLHPPFLSLLTDRPVYHLYISGQVPVNSRDSGRIGASARPVFKRVAICYLLVSPDWQDRQSSR